MANGYMGNVLLVDLTTGKMEDQKIPDEVYETMLSGIGLGAYYLYNNIPAGADPLGPDNILGFVSGLLGGTSTFYAGRFLTVCKSPASGGWGDSNCGGTFAPAIKQCGYDAIFFKGISEKPVYLYVDNKGPQLKDASHVWGLDAVEAEETLEKENWTVKKPKIAVIGTAGENLSYISGIANDKGRIAARGGHGAVMGSKHLKAVVLCGSKSIKVADLETIKEINKKHAEKVRVLNLPSGLDGAAFAQFGQAGVKAQLDGTEVCAPSDGGEGVVGILKKYGSAGAMGASVSNGDTPTKNWGNSTPQDISQENILKFVGDTFIEKEYKKYHCYACAIGCGGLIDIGDVKDGRFKESHKPEYESAAALGVMNFNFDIDSVYYANEILNRAGMDTISAGATVSFAMELYEKGIITKEDTDGLDLSWGNSDAVLKLLEKMIAREGFGDVLADGIKVAAEKIGGDAPKYAVHAGGIEPGMHDSRKAPTMGVNYVLDAAPGKHTTASTSYHLMYQSWHDVDWVEEPAPYNKNEEYVASNKIAKMSSIDLYERMIIDGVGACLVGALCGFYSWKIYDYVNAATGWNKPAGDILLAGKAIATTRQMFNVKHGINPSEVYVHPRILGGFTEGPLAYKEVPLEGMRAMQWDYMGWDAKTGVPKAETIAELKLDKILAEG